MPNTITPADWSELAQGTDAPATASHAESNSKFNSIITFISGSYDDGSTGELIVRDGGQVVYRGLVQGALNVPFEYRGSASVEAEISAGAAGSTGTVVLAGFTEAVYR
jgi:hypothetical protein